MKTPLKALDPAERNELLQELHDNATNDIDLPQLLACLWLHLCHIAHTTPAEAKAGRPKHGPIAHTWSAMAAKALGHCPYAMATRAGAIAATATTLHRQALERRAAAACTPSLF